MNGLYLNSINLIGYLIIITNNIDINNNMFFDEIYIHLSAIFGLSVDLARTFGGSHYEYCSK